MNISNTTSKFNYNPFAGISDSDIENIIVPKITLESIKEIINSGKHGHVEFLGRQGRGKTTHLQWLANLIPEIPIYLLHSNSDFQAVLEDESEVLFVDSIHHLPFFKRVKLFKSKRSVIFTTHWTRKMECMCAQAKLLTVHFKGIELGVLKTIIDKRLSLAAGNHLNIDEYFSQNELNQLIKKHNDNYRGIINQLYDKFQI